MQRNSEKLVCGKMVAYDAVIASALVVVGPRLQQCQSRASTQLVRTIQYMYSQKNTKKRKKTQKNTKNHISWCVEKELVTTRW